MTSREDASRYPVHEIDPGFSGRAPVQPPAVPAMMCVFCAHQALITDGLQDDPDTANLTPRFHRALRRSGPGTWQVPIARLVADGNSVCVFHLIHPKKPVPVVDVRQPE